MRKLIGFSLAIALVAGGVLVGCQGYQFEEVTPKAVGTVKQAEPIVGIQKPAKIMLALDKSGSMKTLASSDTQWGCADDGSGNGYNAAGDCKWITLKNLLIAPGGFLDQTAGSARHGLAIFSDPNSGDACAAGVVTVAIPDVAGSNIKDIKDALASYTPVGGTPSASTLRTIAGDSTFAKKEAATKSYVVLITDGQPNCNSSLGDCRACTNGGDPTKMCGDVRNCLDDVALVSAVKTLKAKEIETFVIGFGSAFVNPDAKKVLDDAAEAGGKAQVNAATKFYLAGDAASLKNILDYIKTAIQPCSFDLAQTPQEWNLLEVSVTDTKAGGDNVLARPSTKLGTDGDWHYNDDTLRSITIDTTWCKKLQEAEADTYVVNFTSLRKL